MPWIYSQRTGQLCLDDIPIEIGYSGHGAGVNDPEAQDERNVGPIPQGIYRIGQAFSHPVLGPLAIPLRPNASNIMFGRSGFYIHGDNASLNRTASEGCIILSRSTRMRIAESEDTVLIVTE